MICDPIFTVLTKALGDKVFRDYFSAEELFEIEIEADEMRRIGFRAEVLDKPFFESLDGNTQKAGAVGNDIRDLGHRAGYVRPPAMQDFRAEVMFPGGMLLLWSIL